MDSRLKGFFVSSPSELGAEERVRARVLRWFLAVFAITHLVLITGVLTGLIQAREETGSILWTGFAVTGIAALLSFTRHYRAACLLVVLMIEIGVAYPVIVNPAVGAIGACLPYLLIPVLLASLVLPTAWLLGVLGVSGAMYAMVAFAMPVRLLGDVLVQSTCFATAALITVIGSILHKRQKESMENTAPSFAEMAEQMNEVFWMRDLPTERMLYVSPAYRRIWGTPMKAGDRANFLETIVPEDRWIVSANFQRNLPVLQEFRIQRPDGERRWIRNRVVPIRDESGVVRRVCGVASDITAEKESHLRLRGILDATPIGYVIGLTDGTITEANDRFLNMLGLSRGVLERGELDFSGITAPGFAPLHKLASSTPAATGATVLREKELLHRDGRRVPVLVSVSPFAGGHEALIVFVVDLSEEKRATELLEMQRARMLSAAKLSALGEMSAGIAHEINNPLAVIQMWAAQLKELGTSHQLRPELAAQVAEKIEGTVERIARIVRALKMLSAGGEGEPFRPIDLRPILDETLELCRERSRHARIEFRVSPLPNGLTVEGRGVQISQILVNLLNNACYAAEKLAERWIAIDVAERGDCVELSVTDSGHGIPAELRDKVFQPFFTTKEAGKGTGLGLSVSRAIAQSHGGSLSLDAQSPNTRFVLRLAKHARPSSGMRTGHGA